LNGVAKSGQAGAATIITVTSGKGGVGKTNVATSLAIRLAQSGNRAVLLDMDLGLANAHVLLGLRPQHSLADVLTGRKDIEDVMLSGPGNIQFVPGGTGDEELANLPQAPLQRLIKSLRRICASADYLVIDTAAGLSRNTMTLARAADAVTVVTTPEPTALLDAYAMFKSLKAGSQPDLYLLVNMARTPQEGNQAVRRLDTVIRSFWQSSLDNAHCVPFDDAVGAAVRARAPVLLSHPNSPAAASLRAFADAVAARRVATNGAAAKEQSLLARLLESLKVGT
jgi:flagellar biosynthesis protein FlhG